MGAPRWANAAGVPHEGLKPISRPAQEVLAEDLRAHRFRWQWKSHLGGLAS